MRQVRPAVLLDFSNLRGGGSLQVASAMLQDLSSAEVVSRYSWLAEGTHIWISPAVARNLLAGVATLPGVVTTKETLPSLLAPFRRPRQAYDVRFTLFGPTYTGRIARREILGFADGSLLHASNAFGQRRSGRLLIGAAVKRALLQRSDLYVTETQALATRLSAEYRIPTQRIVVEPNRPHPLFCSAEMMEPRSTGSAAGELHVAYPARAYAHKNFTIVGPAGDIYAKRSGKRLVVHVTLREEEWRHLPEDARLWVRNHGEANVQQVLDIYRQVDAVFFPSLLETSSATPLEANVLGIPLIASDRSFVRASSQAFALFEPRDPDSIADSLCRFDAARAEAWEQARSIAIAYRQALSAGSRTERYLDMISGELQRLQGEKPRSG